MISIICIILIIGFVFDLIISERKRKKEIADFVKWEQEGKEEYFEKALADHIRRKNKLYESMLKPPLWVEMIKR